MRTGGFGGSAVCIPNDTDAGRGIDPAAVAFDIDSVVADTMTLFLDIARDEHRIEGIRYEDITAYNLCECLNIEPGIIDKIVNRIQDGGYRAPLKPICGAPRVLARIGRHHRPVLMVTARPHPGPIPEWIRTTLHLPDSHVEIVATGSFEGKLDVLLQRGISFFVEDRLETCYGLSAAGVTPILFRQPWNRMLHPFMEIGGWHELEALMHLPSG